MSGVTTTGLILGLTIGLFVGAVYARMRIALSNWRDTRARVSLLQRLFMSLLTNFVLWMVGLGILALLLIGWIGKDHTRIVDDRRPATVSSTHPAPSPSRHR